MEYLLGLDVGSSSVKATLLDIGSGTCAGSAFQPPKEQRIDVPQPGFAEQDPAVWYAAACDALREAMHKTGARAEEIKAVGIAYQMHGLICVDENHKVLRPAIIWCDSRAAPLGEAAFRLIGAGTCLSRLMNSPGNFTAAKLAWVKEHEPELYRRTRKVMLPGDWLAMKFTGEARTTVPGLSEGTLWDFKTEAPAAFLLDHFGVDPELLPDQVPTFGVQGELTAEAANDLGLAAGTPVTYRSGDQPNNAFSLNVLNPGEIAASAGTSGVVYGVTDQKKSDPQSRINTFAHVNHTAAHPRLGLLLCINGTGILNAWTKRLLGSPSYLEMNRQAEHIPAGADGLIVLPFGNGVERMLGNRNLGAQVAGIDLNRHGRSHLCRAVQEGIAFSFMYGMEIMAQTGLDLKTIRAGEANMFMSPAFCSTLANVSGARIELFDTDGALGAARGAGIGIGIFAGPNEALAKLQRKRVIEPDGTDLSPAYARWETHLNTTIHQKENQA